MGLISHILFSLLAIIAFLLVAGSYRRQIPVSVNYHFTRRCNKSCGFCFHTAKTSHIEQSDRAKEGLLLLKKAGMRKINFAGGEPFLYPKFLGEMVDFCKETLCLESVSIVTNGSLVKEDFLKKHSRNIDILAVSCDSFDEGTNTRIGRGSGDQVQQLYNIASWCRLYGVKFKLNTVVCKLNYREDMNSHIDELRPFRWKCFQVLIVPGENDSIDTLRNGHTFTITDEEFEVFCRKHRGQRSLVPEPNRLMAQSYLILDEYMRFLDKDCLKTSESILTVGVQEALKSVHWDKSAFLERGGIYDWGHEKNACSEAPKELEW
jgi:radical S-adenosyl methionine domain-containing protein 2